MNEVKSALDHHICPIKSINVLGVLYFMKGGGGGGGGVGIIWEQICNIPATANIFLTSKFREFISPAKMALVC